MFEVKNSIQWYTSVYHHHNFVIIQIWPQKKVKAGSNFSAGVSPISIPSPNFDLDIFVRNLGLDAEFLEHLLVQLPYSEIERVLEEQVSTPHSDRDLGKAGQSRAGSFPIIPEFYLDRSPLRIIYVLGLNSFIITNYGPIPIFSRDKSRFAILS